MPSKYTPEELRQASNRVMKSLNGINAKSTRRVLTKPAIPNSSAASEGKISKMARKRQRRKEKTNLAGKPITDLLDVLPQAEAPEIVPIAEAKEAEVKKTGDKARVSRKAEKKIVQFEIQAFGRPRSLDEIRQSIAKRNAES